MDLKFIILVTVAVIDYYDIPNYNKDHTQNLMVDKREIKKMHDMKMYYIQILFTRFEGNLCFNLSKKFYLKIKIFVIYDYRLKTTSIESYTTYFTDV